MTTTNKSRDHAQDAVMRNVSPAFAKAEPAIATGLTAQQVRWAQQHDWYRGAERTSAEGLLYRVWCRPDDCSSTRPSFTDYQELREWAGY